MAEVIGIDHIYFAVADLDESAEFYDKIMAVLGFRKNEFQLDSDRHIQYYNRHFGFVLRPARTDKPHDPYAPGLHHFCLRVMNEDEVTVIAAQLKAKDIAVSEPRYYPQYAPDYYAIFLSDPDGIELEITNYRQERRHRHDHWDE